jgi:hypothetical protein
MFQLGPQPVSPTIFALFLLEGGTPTYAAGTAAVPTFSGPETHPGGTILTGNAPSLGKHRPFHASAMAWMVFRRGRDPQVGRGNKLQ